MGKYVAFNKKSNVVVGWLGYTATAKGMKERLKEYHSPSYVVPIKQTPKKRRG